MAPYASQLEYIRQRALPQSDLKLAENLTTFYAAYAGIVTQTCIKYRLDSTEVQQYEAEKRLFKIICKLLQSTHIIFLPQPWIFILTVYV